MRDCPSFILTVRLRDYAVSHLGKVVTRKYSKNIFDMLYLSYYHDGDSEALVGLNRYSLFMLVDFETSTSTCCLATVSIGSNEGKQMCFLLVY